MKVRDKLKSYDEDPGWFQHPPGTVAVTATNGDLARDGIDINTSNTGRNPHAPPKATEPAATPPARTTDPHRGHFKTAYGQGGRAQKARKSRPPAALSNGKPVLK